MKWAHVMLAGALLGLSYQSAIAAVKPMVDGGSPVQEGALPFLVDIEGRWAGEAEWFHVCGASLIAEDLVVSAAHCFFDPSTGLPHDGVEWRLVFDRTDRTLPAEHVAEHAEFTVERHPDKDFVVILLAEQRKGATVARLPPLGITPPAGMIATLAGWGYTEGDMPSDQLLKVDVPIIASDRCDVPYDEARRLQLPAFPRLCAGEPGKGSRAGDSGGPLFTRDAATGDFILRGIVSGGRPGLPDGYVNLADPALW